MKAGKILSYLLLVFAVISVMPSGLFAGDADSTDFFYDSDLVYNNRKQKDFYFRNPDSPIPDDEKKGFKGLIYYDPTPKFVVKAKLEPFTTQDTIELKTNRTRNRLMVRYGKFKFSLNGREYELVAFLPLNTYSENLLFVPFGDATNGSGTYEGGRYLDVELQAQGLEYWLDFNQAYNPYCVYNKIYTCPLVPNENILPAEIKAGEKNYKH